MPGTGSEIFDKAVKDFDQAIKIAPKDAAAINERAQVWIDKGQFDRATQDYEQAISLGPRIGEPTADWGKPQVKGRSRCGTRQSQ